MGTAYSQTASWTSTTAVTCATGEVCMVKMIRHKDGRRAYTSGCATQKACQESGKNNAKECRFQDTARRGTAQCYSCCTGANCNSITLVSPNYNNAGTVVNSDFSIGANAP